MKHLIHAAAAAGLCAALLFSLTGCGHSSNTFTWGVDETPNNLDPQLAVTSANRIAVTHLYSGLFRLGPDGQVNKECAQDYTISPDGLTYTFTLKEGLVYHTTKGRETPYTVTAEDFVFGLQRVFLPETRSPYAAELGNIQGSDVVLNGGSRDALAVKALDDLTLEIRLQAPDEDFLKKLCLPGAMPCDQEFFESTGGAYGLTKANTISNGSFYLYNWTEGGLFLRRPAQDHLVDNLRLVAPADDSAPASSSEEEEKVQDSPAKMVLDGKWQAALAEGDGGEEADGLIRLPYTSTTWTLVFNSSGPFASRDLRAALAQVAWNEQTFSMAGAIPATGLFPPALELNGSGLPHLGEPSELYHRGLEQSGKSNLTGMTILVPPECESLFSSLNQEWQRQLQVYFSIKEVPLSTLQDWLSGRLSAGEVQQLEQKNGPWAVALLPVAPTSADPASLLYQFDGSLGNWQDSEFHNGLTKLTQMPSGPARREEALRLEQRLLEQSVAVPLFYQSNALLVSPEIQGLVFDPFGPLLDLTYATKK